MDVSRSMCATDIPPNRLVAAEAGRGVVRREPGRRHADRDRGLRRLRRDGPGTDQRRGGAARRHRVARDRPADRDRQRDPRVDRRHRRDRPVDRRERRRRRTRPPARRRPCRRAPIAPAIIVLLTDGASNAGPEPVEAAQQAVDRGIRVYTIGFGTEDPGGRPPRCGAQFDRPRAGRQRPGLQRPGVRRRRVRRRGRRASAARSTRRR